MKATGIVRRIDDCVIIGTKVRSLENTELSLILSDEAKLWKIKTAPQDADSKASCGAVCFKW